MRNLRLLSTTAAILLLGAGAVSAQTSNKDEGSAHAPAAERHAPAEKIAPTMKSGQRKMSQTTGQAAPNAGEHDKSQMKKSQTMDKGNPAGHEVKRSTDANGGTNIKDRRNAAESHPAMPSRNSTAEHKGGTAGQGAAAGSHNLSGEQRGKMTTVFRQHRVTPAHLNVSVRVGRRIPDSVHFYPLPVEVYAFYPEWRGYYYILVGDEILVIDPRSHQIVAILDA
jgi:hypothetical protein